MPSTSTSSTGTNANVGTGTNFAATADPATTRTTSSVASPQLAASQAQGKPLAVRVTSPLSSTGPAVIRC